MSRTCGAGGTNLTTALQTLGKGTSEISAMTAAIG